MKFTPCLSSLWEACRATPKDQLTMWRRKECEWAGLLSVEAYKE